MKEKIILTERQLLCRQIWGLEPVKRAERNSPLMSNMSKMIEIRNSIGELKLSELLPALKKITSDYNLNINRVSEFKIALSILKVKLLFASRW